MERVVGWAGIDDSGYPCTTRQADPRQSGMRLRPTGMVVFATLDRGDGAEPGSSRSDAPWHPGASHDRARDLRSLAWRGAAWLLGR